MKLDMNNINDINKVKEIIKKVLKIIIYIIMGIGLCVLVGFVIMWLWNWLMTDIFELRAIKYWEAVGLFALAKLIFGGFGDHDSDNKQKCNDNQSFSRQFEKEFDKEFDKEFEKEVKQETHNNEGKNNDDYDQMYDQWWKEKGEQSFSEYMNQI